MRTPESYKEHLDLLNDLGIIKKLDALESKSRFLDSIIEIVHELNKETHFSKILTFLVRSIFENIKMTRLTIVYSTLVRGQRFQARVYEGLTEDSALSDQIHFEKNSPIIKSIKALKMATHYHHFLNDLPETDDNPLSLLEPDMIIPMKTRNFFIGFLAIGSSDKDSRYTIDEIKYINAVSDFIAKAIEDSRLKKIMTYDGKSLLLSADYFMIQLNHELEKSMRYNLSFCFALGDLDHFSEINESCGYGFGDRIIKYVGSIIASECRNVDFTARLIGAKFAILMPNTQKDNGLMVLERIRKKISRQNFTKEESIYKTTISFGMIAYPHHEIVNHGDLLKLAESALAKAKQNGRNQVDCLTILE